MRYTKEAVRAAVRKDIELHEPALQVEQRVHAVTYRITEIGPLQPAVEGVRVTYRYNLVFRYPYEEEQVESRRRTSVLSV